MDQRQQLSCRSRRYGLGMVIRVSPFTRLSQLTDDALCIPAMLRQPHAFHGSIAQRTANAQAKLVLLRADDLGLRLLCCHCVVVLLSLFRRLLPVQFRIGKEWSWPDSSGQVLKRPAQSE